MGKARSAAASGKRHDPLHVQVSEDAAYQKFGRVTAPGKRSKGKGREGDEEERRVDVTDPAMSRKILALAREQQDEIEREEAEACGETLELEDDDDDQPMGAARGGEGSEDEEEIEEEEVEEYDVDELEIDPSDQTLLDRFLPPAPSSRRTLADIIFDKIAAGPDGGDAADGGKGAADDEEGGERRIPPGMNEKVVEVYTKVGVLLSRYRSGPLPKAFKIIPSLPAWVSILHLTVPERWTPHATFAATRLFASNLKAAQTRVFYEHVLLERCRENMSENSGKLDYHLYQALKKALYKPAAFFKGILFPLCESGCTLKEAAIFASVLSKVSVPVLHSAAALLRLAEMDYTGPNSLFIRVLLDKKYALPYKVVDALVFHFLRFARDERKMPVLWHQSLLVFCQRYKSDLTPDQKDALLDAIKIETHHQISPEVRRELVNSVPRGEAIPDAPEVDMDF